MQLFRRTLLQGAHDRLVDAGRMLPFANEKLATEVFDKIASDMGIPPILSERPNQQQALALGNSLIDYSQKLAANGHGPDNELMGLAKQASTKDPAERALVTAEYYIQKAAEEGSIRDSGGTGLLAAGGHDPMARLDLMNRATGAYAVQQGQSNFPMPGVLGRELAAPGAPGTGANVSQKIAENDLTIEQLRARSEQMANAARQQSSMAQPAAIRGSAVVPSAIQGFWTEAPSGSGGRLPSSQSWTNALDAAPAPQRLNALDVAAHGLPVDPHNPTAMQQLRQEFGSSNRQHLEHWSDRTPWGKARSAGVIGARAAGVGGAVLAAGLGARALYRHFNPEEKAASVKQALDMPDFGKTWDSIKGMTRYYRDRAGEGMGARAQQVGNFFSENAQGLGDRLTDARNAQQWVGSSAEALQGLGHSDASMRALRNQNLMEALGHGARLAAPAAGLAAAGGLAYGGKKLYDHLQGSPEDMEVNASDDSLGALALALQEHGIEPTPELLTELHEAMEAEEGGGGGSEMPPGAPSGQEPPKQAAEGSLHPTPPGNKLTGAAAHDPVAALDVKNRAPGAYKVPQGQTQLSTASGTIGDEKKASEEAWRQNIVKTAQEWGPHLPAAWPDNVKHAAIQNIAAQPPAARLDFVKSLLSR